MENKTNLKETVVNFFKNLSKPARIGIIAGAVALVLVIALVIGLAVGGKDNGNNNDNGTNNGTTDNGGNDNNTPTEVDYKLAIGVDSSVDESNKVSNYVVALLLDKDNKIVDVKIDCLETTITAENGEIVNVENVASKVELGDSYMMNSGSFAKQAAAFEDAIIGKTADEVANLDMSLVAGCTMPYSPYSFKAVIAKAFASTNKTTFKADATKIALGLGATMEVSDGKATLNVSGVVVKEGKLVASILDTAERSFTLESETITAGAYNGTKVELGDSYMMNSGSFAKQAAAFEDAIVGKTADEIANLDMSLVAGCTMPYSPYAFKAVLAEAIANAK